METFIIILCLVLIVMIAIFFIIRKKNNEKYRTEDASKNGETTKLALHNQQNLTKSKYEMTIRFEDLPALTEKEECSLVEVKDKSLLARIDNVVPGTLQTIGNTAVAKKVVESAKSMKNIYQVIIPKGAELTNSKAMNGAFRAFFRGKNNIQGQANLIPVEGLPTQGLATMNVVNGAMSVAAIVVGQYYMTQINNQLKGISDSISKIADFQDNEYKSKVFALVAEVQKISTFRFEIIENDELRNRELAHLKELEYECAQLLGQANLAIQNFVKNKGVDYSEYESLVFDINKWYQYQQVLLEVLYMIADLTHALNLGAVTRENSCALYLMYAKQSDDTLKKLATWHEDNNLKLKIDLELSRRRRQGIEGFIMNIPALFDDDLHYKTISENTVHMINKQKNDYAFCAPRTEIDLFNEDVRLIAKDGKLFYLPKTQD